ncbi:MAG: TonB-dependent receptor plug domain-containing protein [Pseudomonadota bacterium]|nr:TonB-dependent receptor plug domain-containing protein [Pseudomonadota bacterium]
MPSSWARRRTGLNRALALSAAFVVPAAPLLAQDSGNAPPPQPTLPNTSAGPRIYTPADFARFAPRNAADMLRQVPGFILQRPDDRRGLGDGGGNVLINGRRVSGKSNDALTELGRIPARNVTRIEIVEGATLNVPGLTGQVANVIATLGGTSGQFAWRPELRARAADPLLLRGEASLSGSSGPFGYTIGIRNEAFRGGGSGPSLIFGPDGTLIDTRQEVITVRGDRPKLSGSFKYEGPGGSVANLNLSYGRFWFGSREVSERSGLGQVDRIRSVRSEEKDYSYEIGGDYEFPLGPGQLKLIGLYQFEHSPTNTRAITTFADEAPGSGSRFTRVGEQSESIARAEYRGKSGPADWQISAEAAFNSLDNVSGLFTLLPGGEFQEVLLPGGSALVNRIGRRCAPATAGRSPPASRCKLQLARNIPNSAKAGSRKPPGHFTGPRVFSRQPGRPRLPSTLPQSSSGRSGSSTSSTFSPRKTCPTKTAMPAIRIWCRRKAGNWIYRRTETWVASARPRYASTAG